MASPTIGDWLERHARLPYLVLAAAADVWTILQAVEPERPIPVLKAQFGTPEYAAAAVILTAAAVVLFVGWLRQYLPSVKFHALYDDIAACCDDAAAASVRLNPDMSAVPQSMKNVDDMHRFVHRLDEVRGDLGRLNIELPTPAPGYDGTRDTHSHLRFLAERARAGDVRGARARWKST